MINFFQQIEKKAFSIVWFFSLVFLSFNISNVSQLYFDEQHYIPAAMDWLKNIPTTNLEHPPLAKLLMAASIKFFGNNSMGWRFPSALLGSLAIFFLMKISSLIFKDKKLALMIGFFTLSNFWIYIFSRVALLEIYFVSFSLAGIYYALNAEIKKNKRNFFVAGFFWGLAVASKWSALILLLPFMLTLLIKRKWQSVPVFIISGVTYFVTFLPYFYTKTVLHRSFKQIFFDLPLEMYELQKSVSGSHPYQSEWYTWPLMYRPIWFYFEDPVWGDFIKGVLLLGNPLQMLLGLLSVVFLVIKFFQIEKQSQRVLLFFILTFFIWAVIPRKISYFYYFFPTALVYSLLIPICLREWFGAKKSNYIFLIICLISFGFFLYFFPLLTGEYIEHKHFQQMMWLKSWI
ncbi:MAG: glycosyltransferase family 39 protein [Bdellovibrionaceae bacterium]|nr:glycosyltransferase family 39 protein [Pseudobdellovibrionaceae bacterium]NUM57745.1 glycosyltransferase family 39 protein [Pseudobdellovibrionaceae bacterium]